MPPDIMFASPEDCMLYSAAVGTMQIRTTSRELPYDGVLLFLYGLETLVSRPGTAGKIIVRSWPNL
jgi:hypothetical protein